MVQETGQLKGVGLELKGSDGLTAGDVDILTDSYIIEVKKSLGAVKLKQLDKLINSNNPNFFNYDGKKIIYYIEKIDTNSVSAKEALAALDKSGVTVISTLDELKGVLSN